MLSLNRRSAICEAVSLGLCVYFSTATKHSDAAANGKATNCGPAGGLRHFSQEVCKVRGAKDHRLVNS